MTNEERAEGLELDEQNANSLGSAARETTAGSCKNIFNLTNRFHLGYKLLKTTTCNSLGKEHD